MAALSASPVWIVTPAGMFEPTKSIFPLLYFIHTRRAVGRSVKGRPKLTTPSVPLVTANSPAKRLPAASLMTTFRLASLADFVPVDPGRTVLSSGVTLSFSLRAVEPLLPVPQKGEIGLPVTSERNGSHGLDGLDHSSSPLLGSCSARSVVTVVGSLSSSPQ